MDDALEGLRARVLALIDRLADGTRDDATGIREFNVGTGGKSLELPTVAIHPNSETRDADYGVLSLTLYADHYDWQFRPVAGAAYTDSGSQACH